MTTTSARRLVAWFIGASAVAYDASAQPTPDLPPFAAGITSSKEPLKSLYIHCIEQVVPPGSRSSDCEFIEVRIRAPRPPPTPAEAAQFMTEMKRRMTPANFAKECAHVEQTAQDLPAPSAQLFKSACAAHDVSAFASAILDYEAKSELNTCGLTAVSWHRSLQRTSGQTWTSVDTIGDTTEVWTLSKRRESWIAHVARTHPGSKDQPASTETEDYAFPVAPVELPCKYLH